MCVEDGRCADAAPTCAVGEYLAFGSSDALECAPCPAGRYGAREGLTAAACSGPCAEGHVCPEGSTTPRALACGGGAHVFCPLGSARPTPVAAGFYTISSIAAIAIAATAATDAAGDVDDESSSGEAAAAAAMAATTRAAQRPCERGTWCVAKGSRCPALSWHVISCDVMYRCVEGVALPWHGMSCDVM